MKNIYLVTHGSYSDYKVLAAFSSEELANAWKKQHSKTDYEEDYEVETYSLDEDPPKLKSWWRSKINIYTGEIVSKEHKYELDEGVKHTRYGNNLLDYYYNSKSKNIPNEFTFDSYVSQEHADKIAIENHQKFLRLYDKSKLKQTRYNMEYYGFPKN